MNYQHVETKVIQSEDQWLLDYFMSDDIETISLALACFKLDINAGIYLAVNDSSKQKLHIKKGN